MNKSIIIVAVIILLLVGTAMYIANQQSQKAEQAKMAQEKAAMEKKDGDKMMGDKMSDSRYVEYSKTVLDQSADKRRVLYFYASWCPICRPADANFKQNTSKIPKDMVVVRVNYNDPDTDREEKDLAKKYGITYQHTFVQIDTQGKEVTKWNGGQIEELLANIK